MVKNIGGALLTVAYCLTVGAMGWWAYKEEQWWFLAGGLAVLGFFFMLIIDAKRHVD